jgi:beta-N-acetylhexosaminidase
MTDEEALAQTIMLAWGGAEPSPLILRWVRERRIGGIKIFGWNTDDSARLAQTIAALQEAALSSGQGIPLLIATDQEGGMVRHIKGATSETPGNMALGASGRPIDAYLAGRGIGAELALLGINMNFAPNVDLFTNPQSLLVGTRSFGSGPAAAGLLGAAFMKGLLAAGVIPTAKHFPGHGATDLDSHGTLPRVYASFETLWERELIPYRLLAREKIPALMSGHIAFPATPAGEAPASLSRWFLHDVLREKMGFEGIVITDDLVMMGATDYAGSLASAAKQALAAGNDVILLSNIPSLEAPLWHSLLQAMRSESAFRARVHDAARRILETKLRALRGPSAPPLRPDPQAALRGLAANSGRAAFFQDLAARSVTIVQGADALPLRPEAAGRVLLAGQFGDFFKAGSAAYPGAAVYWYTPDSAEEIQRLARGADTLIFCLSAAAGLPILEACRGLNKRVIVFSALNPGYLTRARWADAALALYSYAPESFAAGFSALRGAFEAQGALPFEAP